MAERDEGFSLVEVIVSIGLIGIVMAGLTIFFASSIAITSLQSGRQTAVQLADSAMERVRAVDGTEVHLGRTQQAVDDQWSRNVPGIGRPGRTGA